MSYRYCPDGGKWLETADYTTDEQGETVCPVHGCALVGHIPPRPGRQKPRKRDVSWPYGALLRDQAEAAAEDQNLLFS